MLIDRLDPTTPFGFHIPSDGSQIGGTDPTQYGVFALLGEEPGWQFFTGGSVTPGGYPSVLFYPAVSSTLAATAALRTILPNTGSLALAFDLVVGNAAAIGGNVIETDVLVVQNALKFNLSGQRHIATGQIDIGNWTDTGIRAGALAPNVKHKVRWQYGLSAKNCSVLTYTCDGVTYPIPVKLQNMPATPTNWATGVYIQIQMGSLPNATPWAEQITDLRLEWD